MSVSDTGAPREGFKADGEAIAKRTMHGIRFGAMKALCTMSLPGGRSVVTVQTDAGRNLDIYCTKTGRSLRVFSGGKEWHPHEPRA